MFESQIPLFGADSIRIQTENLSTIQIKNGGEVSCGRKCVTNVVGVVTLEAAPHFGLVLVGGSVDHPFRVRLVTVDIADGLSQWISVVGKTVCINQLMIVYERFENFHGCPNSECCSAFVMWKDVNLLDISLQHKKPPEKKDSSTKEVTSEPNERSRIVVHHVSSPFSTEPKSAKCLVLVSYINRHSVEKKLWLVLQNEQVAWREFLLPNREYLIEVPQQSCQFRLDDCIKHLEELIPKSCQLSTIMFHHKNLFATLFGAMLPIGTKMYLTSNTTLSAFIHRMKPDNSSLWFSCSEADNADVGLVSCYGQVNMIKYDKETVFKSCYLCIQVPPKSPARSTPMCDKKHPWSNPWVTKQSEDEQELALPEPIRDSSVMKTGVPAKLVQILKLRDPVTLKEQSVYVKHSFVAQTQEMCRLAPGMVVCMSHLNRRRSGMGNFYYITTFLSALHILAVPTDTVHSESWGVYGFKEPSVGQMWGVLETSNLYKVTVSAKCAHCSGVFCRNACTEDCLRPSPRTSAIAIGWVQFIGEDSSLSMRKVLIKDDLVREMLCIPEKVWQTFLKVALQEEIICFFSEQDLTTSPLSSNFCELFKMYCSIPKPNGKYYISVKKLSAYSDNEPFYYCLDLKPVEEKQLKIVGELVKNCETQ